jgi:DNA-binding NtrC family response regulator
MPQTPVNILVVDDELDQCNALQEVLRDEGYIVNTVQEIDEAIRHLDRALDLNSREKRYAVVIIDLQFDNAEHLKNEADEYKTAGLRVARAALKKDPFIEPVILTGHGTEEAAIRALELGAFRYVRKASGQGDRSHFDHLRSVVHRALEVRDFLLGVEDSYEELKRIFQRLKTGGADPAEIEHAQDLVFSAEQVFRRMLSERGKSPDSTQYV